MSSITTLADLPAHLLRDFGDREALLRRSLEQRMESLSTREVGTRVRELSVALTAIGIEPGDRVAVIAESRPEWCIADLATLTSAAITVPIYPTLSIAQVQYILCDSGSRAAVVSDDTQLRKILEVQDRLPSLRTVMVMDPSREAPAAAPQTGPLEVLTLAAALERGRALIADRAQWEATYTDRIAAIRPEDVATIIYTSGTTGEPKGVMLTHRNIISNIEASLSVLPLYRTDEALSFLPLSHSFERTVLYRYLYSGITTTFAQSLDTVGRDMALVKPTVMTAVPRVFEKLHGRVMDSVAQSSPVRKRLFHWALGIGLAHYRAEASGRKAALVTRLQHPLADRLVFSKIRARTGGKLRCLASGSAPLSKEIGEFFFAIGLPITEGYGLTETAPILTINPLDAPRLGTVGKPIPGVDIRIAEDGEILARGPNVMLGYHRKPEATREALADGWFHTGDVGRFDEDGYLIITDRKKDLLITSGGKKLAPQPVEQRLKASPLVSEAVLIADRRKFVAVLIGPNVAALQARLRERGEAIPPVPELLRRPDVIQLYQSEIDRLNEQLAQFERIKRFALLPTEFTIESGELTPTLKVRRKVVEQKWKDVIEELYGDRSRDQGPGIGDQG